MRIRLMERGVIISKVFYQLKIDDVKKKTYIVLS